MRKKLSIALLSLFFTTLAIFYGVSHITSRTADESFEQFTEDLFCQEVASSTITLHYTLKDPSTYGIENVPVTYGNIGTDSADVCAAAENALAVLHSHKRGKLSEENQITYDVLDYYLNSSLAQGQYLLYEEPLAPLTGTQSQLPILLSEYRFYNTSDVDTYLELLAQTPEYFRSIIAFERAKSDAGLFMASYCVDAIVEECNSFIDMGGNNYLYSSFDERIDELALTPETAELYKKKNRENVVTYVIPSYQELISVLQELRETGKNNNGLCYLPDGSRYYELSVASQTGSSRTIPELQELTQSQMLDDLLAIQEILVSETDNISASSDVFKSQGTLLDNNDPETILDSLRANLSGTFPTPPKVNAKIKYVQESMEEYLSPAFYMIPAIDDTKNNVIYINQGHLPDDLSLFTTLAHEGYPGHLYQTVYYSATDPDPIRNLLNFGGYTEGWATYTEMLSYYYAPISKEEATLMQHNTSIILGLYALADMGIHYDGWTLLDTVSFFRSYGITDTNTIEDIYDLIIADPGNYLKYYIGYVEFLELKKDAITAWGDEFTQERFHKEVLEAGPAPFDIIQKILIDVPPSA